MRCCLYLNSCCLWLQIFAAQNPMSQGGGRKGLPASFLNRFTKVYLSSLERDDLLYITRSLYPTIPAPTLAKMVDFNQNVHEDTMVHRKYGHQGAPWEFNLRDVFRWCDLVQAAGSEALAAIRAAHPTSSSGESKDAKRMETDEDSEDASMTDAAIVKV